MKDKVREAAGKTWRYLGQNGEINVAQLPKILKEKDTVIYQALGWLAREDKLAYTTKNRRTFVSLVQSELGAFNNVMYNIQQDINKQPAAKAKTKSKIKGR